MVLAVEYFPSICVPVGFGLAQSLADWQFFADCLLQQLRVLPPTPSLAASLPRPAPDSRAGSMVLVLVTFFEIRIYLSLSLVLQVSDCYTKLRTMVLQIVLVMNLFSIPRTPHALG